MSLLEFKDCDGTSLHEEDEVFLIDTSGLSNPGKFGNKKGIVSALDPQSTIWCRFESGIHTPLYPRRFRLSHCPHITSTQAEIVSTIEIPPVPEVPEPSKTQMTREQQAHYYGYSSVHEFELAIKS